jgi:hypothetical protein
VEAAGFKRRSKKRETDFTRERKMGFKKLVYFMLSMIKESTQNALERYFAMNGEETFMSQQAFSEACQKIKWEAFLEMFDFTVATHYQINEIERWNGYRLFAIDLPATGRRQQTGASERQAVAALFWRERD